MCKSLGAYIAAFGKWGFVMAAIIIGDGIGIIQSYFTSCTIPTWVWWSILVVILVIAPFIAFHKQRLVLEKLQNKLDDIENEKPLITVKPEVYYSDKAVLEVNNEGADAIFTATARVVRGNIEPNLFSMYWQNHPNTVACPINSRGSEPILVAEISPNSELNDNERTAVLKGGIALYQTGGKRIGVSDYQVIEDAKLKKRYPEMSKNEPELINECEIEVTITSAPQLSEAFSNRRYLIKIDYENNDKLVFTSVLNSP